MTGITVADAAGLTGGTLHGDGAALISCVRRDNREICPGDMFAALPGERTDGHAYIKAALDAGASCALALRVPEGESRPVIVVPDVAAALCELARRYRESLHIPIIGVTGSVGKTTCKEMLYSVLSQKYRTLKTEKNFNNNLGVPLTVCRIDGGHQAAVVELGISHFGEMSAMGAIVRPEIAVYTNIGRAHLEFLGDRQGVMRAKGELLERMPDEGLVVVNGDDDILSALSTGRRKLCCGLNGSNDVRARDVSVDSLGRISCRIVSGKRNFPVSIPAFGRHMIYAALLSAGVAMELGLDDEQIAAGIAAYEPVGRRASVERTEYLTIVDDCYNANPDSTAAAISSAADLPGRLVCILGDMFELGEREAELHRETGALAKGLSALLLTVGELSKNMGGEHFESKRGLIEKLPTILQKGDVVLVKASHSMAFEEISEALKGMVL